MKHSSKKHLENTKETLMKDTRDATVLRVAGSGAPLSPLLHRQGLGGVSGEAGSTARPPTPAQT